MSEWLKKILDVNRKVEIIIYFLFISNSFVWIF
jgi:hypothetical protein